MKSPVRVFVGTFLALTLVFTVASVTVLGCAKSSVPATRYHCPMHPTYISDKPGDCPICGMRLVPLEEKHRASVPSATPNPIAGQPPQSPGSGGHGVAEQSTWTCPMHPDVVSRVPGRCPQCNMPLEPVPKSSLGAPPSERRVLFYRSPSDPLITSANPTKDFDGREFVPVYSDASGSSAEPVPGLSPIEVSAEGLRLAGVRTAVVEMGRIARTIRAVGIVRPDEARVRHVHTKSAGWVEKLYVKFTGETVTAGRPILTFYSQEVMAAQLNYVEAEQAAKSSQSSERLLERGFAADMTAASRRRLELLDVPKSRIEELERGEPASRTVTLTSPVSGIVTRKNVFEGQQVDPGTELFAVTDLSKVWLEADVYEGESSAVHEGLPGTITFFSSPGKALIAKIAYVYPSLNAETRTLRVRFNLSNPGLKLRLESYANVEIPVETDEGTIIPDSAILDTGRRQIVYVCTAEGRFEPRLVVVGIRSEGKALIVSGVSAGEVVAVKANFLLDSESRLRAALPLEPSVSPNLRSRDSAAPSHSEKDP